MKINSTEPLHPGAVSPPSTKPSEQKQDGPSFANTLQKSMDAEPTARTLHSVMGGPGICSSVVPEQQQPSENLAIAENVLDAMQRYCEQLADPAVNLRKLASQLDRLEAVAGKAGAVSDMMSERDPVKPIIDDAVAEIRREIDRFNSGLYVDM